MTIFREFLEYVDFLAQDVENLSPATMATLTGFGELGDYDPIYFEILDDVRLCVEVLRHLGSEVAFGVTEAEHFASLRGRDLNDANLTAERDELARDLHEIDTEARRIGEERFCRLWRRAPRDAHRAFIDRLRAVNLGQTADEEPSATDRRAGPNFELAPRPPKSFERHGEAIHVLMESLRKA